MARIRSVHPELCIDETLASVSAAGERTFIRLWTHLDDEGRTADHPKLLKAALYPLHDDVTIDDIDADLDELAAAGLLTRYTVEGKPYLAAKPASWARFQKPRHRYQSKLPGPDAPGADVRPTTVRRRSDVGPHPSVNGTETSRHDTPSDVGPTHVRRTPAGGEGRGGEEGEENSLLLQTRATNERSSSNEQQQPLIDQAARVIAQRRAERSGGKGEGWVVNAARGIAVDRKADFDQALASFPDAQMPDAQALADLVEPPPEPAAPPPDRYDRRLDGQQRALLAQAEENTRRLRAEAVKPAPPERVAEVVAAVRAKVRQPHAPAPAYDEEPF